MRLDEWRFSAALAWRDPFMRWASACAAALVLVVTAFVLWRLVPEGVRSGVIVMHYSMYLGIDDVRAWPWLFAIPGGMIAILLVNALVAAGVYRADALAARVLVGLSCALAIIWAVGSYFLVRINL